jgi:hypothetical protein
VDESVEEVPVPGGFNHLFHHMHLPHIMHERVRSHAPSARASAHVG